MAYGLVQYYDDLLDGHATDHTTKPIENPFIIGVASRRHKKNDIQLDIVLDTPVVVVPRSSNSTEVLVAHLGKISVTNRTHPQAEADDMRTIEEETSIKVQSDDDSSTLSSTELEVHPHDCNSPFNTNDIYSIDIRNMNLFSLDTSNRRGFRM